MAKPRRPARWFLELGRAKARERARIRVQSGMLDPDDVPSYVGKASLQRRLVVRDYLSRTVKDLRRFFTGFDAKDGYNLSNIHTWPRSRADAVERYGGYLHKLQSTPYVVADPKRYRKKAKQALFRKVLRRRTQQGLPRQKKYLYHVEQTARPTEVRLSRTGQLEVREPFKDTYFLRQEWYFRDYLNGRQPVTFNDIIKATTRMLEDLPDRWFTIFDTSYGPIDVPVQKQFLLATLRRYWEEYGTHDGFASALLGVMFLGSREEAMRGYNARLKRRMQAQFAKSERAKTQRRRLAFQKRAGRVR